MIEAEERATSVTDGYSTSAMFVMCRHSTADPTVKTESIRSFY